MLRGNNNTKRDERILLNTLTPNKPNVRTPYVSSTGASCRRVASCNNRQKGGDYDHHRCGSHACDQRCGRSARRRQRDGDGGWNQ
eukprot:1853208-Pyramimonas_sp.AAC.1